MVRDAPDPGPALSPPRPWLVSVTSSAAQRSAWAAIAGAAAPSSTMRSTAGASPAAAIGSVASALASPPDSAARGANAGSECSDANLWLYAQTSWDTWHPYLVALGTARVRPR